MEVAAQGLRVVVTAGAAGIGREIAKTFHDNGARVFICDVDSASLAQFSKLLPQIGAASCDVADAAQVDGFMEQAVKTLGGLDVLVNNAGIAGPTAKVEDITTEEWNRTLAVNMNGMFYCTRRAVPHLKATGGGSIINLSSVAGRFGMPLRTPYSSSKWAVIGFTQSLAIELGPSKIRANAILPGVVEGDRQERVIAAKSQALGISPEAYRERLLAKVSMRMSISAQDIANTALFLASAAGRTISGQSVSVCGNVETLA